MKIAVWIARLILGSTFLLSGVTKMVDPYGVIAKIEAYLLAWDLDGIFPTGVVLVGGCALAMLEFIVGLLLVTGSLRRSSAIAALAIMAFMLPLTAYIAAYNPVDDCGCFGDFLILSNSATMWKNIVLFALALFLCTYNQRAGCLIAPWIQWVEIAAGVVYMLALAIIGYHEQPLLDFRPYPVGEPLVDSRAPEILYLYERDDEHRLFADDELPDESTGWEFVDIYKSSPETDKLLTLFDRRSGEDVTEEVIGATPGQMLLLMPYPSEASASGSYTANELQQAMEKRYGPGSFIAVTAADSIAVGRALDVMMATYPVYYADRKAITTVARGQMAVVYLTDGIVRWKRTLSSVNPYRISEDSAADPAQAYAVDGPRRFRKMTIALAIATVVIAITGSLSFITRLRAARKARRKSASPRK